MTRADDDELRVTRRDDYVLTHPLRRVSDSFDVGRRPDEFVHAVGGLVVESSILTEAIHVPTALTVLRYYEGRLMR